MVAIMVAVGRLHVMVTTWRPAAWLNTMQAFRPLARQCSYSAEKSVVETAGCGVGQTGPSMLAHTPPLTMLAQVGETIGSWGGGEEKLETAGTQPARLACLLPQRERRSGWRGELTAKLLSRCTPHPQWERGDRWQGGLQGAGGEILPGQMLTAY